VALFLKRHVKEKEKERNEDMHEERIVSTGVFFFLCGMKISSIFRKNIECTKE